jgi:hypothetical protein
MVNLTQNDIDVRLQTINCCIGELTNSLLIKIKIGSKDAKCKLQELQILQNMVEALKCYNILSDDVTEEDNCLTEAQAQSMFDYMSTKCDTCFQFPGYTYETSGQFGEEFDESFR